MPIPVSILTDVTENWVLDLLVIGAKLRAEFSTCRDRK